MPAKAAKGTEKKSKTATPAKEPAPSHPKYSEMILTAITELKERKGSSKYAIFKYIHDTYGLEQTSRTNGFLNRTLRSMLEKNEIAHAVGQKTSGASGRFRLPGPNSEEKRGRPKSSSVSPTKPKVKKASPKKSPSPKKASPKKGKK